MVDYGGITEPEGWLWCAGQIIPRTGIYAPLYESIGERWGAGDGVTTFQLPDFRGRVSAGRDDMGGTAANRLQVTQTCSMTSGSATLTVEDVFKLTQGMFIYGPGIPAGTTITFYPSGTTVTMSAPATATASGIPIRFSPVQDPQVLGANGGNIMHQLNVYEMPSHTHYAPTLGTPNGLQAGPHYSWIGVRILVPLAVIGLIPILSRLVFVTGSSSIRFPALPLLLLPAQAMSLARQVPPMESWPFSTGLAENSFAGADHFPVVIVCRVGIWRR